MVTPPQPSAHYIPPNQAVPEEATARRIVAGKQPLLDRYSLGHVAAGIAYASAGMSFWQALAAHGIWEAFESPIKLEYPSLFPVAEIDTPRNITGDLLSAMIGWQAWENVLGKQRTGGGWLFLGVGIFGATAWALRWKQHPPWEAPSFKRAMAAYAGNAALLSQPPQPLVPPPNGTEK